MLETQIAYYTVPLAAWNCEILIVVTPQGIFFPIIDVCAILGIADYKQQVGQLRDNEVTTDYVQKWPVPTPKRGKQVKNCLHRTALGYWLGYIDSRRVRHEIRPNLLKLQQDILAAADHVLFGDVPGLTVSSSATAFQRRLGPISEHIILPESDDE